MSKVFLISAACISLAAVTMAGAIAADTPDMKLARPATHACWQSTTSPRPVGTVEQSCLAFKPVATPAIDSAAPDVNKDGVTAPGK